MLTSASAAEYKLSLARVPANFTLRGLGGSSAYVSRTTVKVFTLAGFSLRNMEFLVGGSDIGAGAAGVIGG